MASYVSGESLRLKVPKRFTLKLARDLEFAEAFFILIVRLQL